ncbi:hairy-related 9 isoform X1 [Chiloscyllium punctatum]|uniref:hairy-related 9 isoform X1 n=1 Tax=Chiloscyllium punctatum TaxID=137246 RepID=UPI003B63E95C
MPTDTMEKPSISPTVGSSANSPQTPDKPKSASENRKVNTLVHVQYAVVLLRGGKRLGRGARGFFFKVRSKGTILFKRFFSSPQQSSKPIMEKRRRARINESLSQLKTLILDALKKDSSRHSKLEKADILEMTVKHLRNLQRVQMTAALTADPTVLGKYRAGFNECMNEVTRFLSTCEGVNTDVRTRLLSHLSSCLGHMVAMNYSQAPANVASVPGAHLNQPLHVQLPATVPASGGVNMPCKLSPAEAASPKVYGGFQLVPATDGHFAFLIPNPAFASSSGQITTGPVIPLYANANLPVAVSSAAGPPNSKLTSPVQGMTSAVFGPNIPGVSQSHSPLGVSTGPDNSESVWRPW